jgi:hypothetical protein
VRSPATGVDPATAPAARGERGMVELKEQQWRLVKWPSLGALLTWEKKRADGGVCRQSRLEYAGHSSAHARWQRRHGSEQCAQQAVAVARTASSARHLSALLARARSSSQRESGSSKACRSERSSGAAAAHQRALVEAKQRRGQAKWPVVGVARGTRTGSGERLTSRAHPNFNI